MPNIKQLADLSESSVETKLKKSIEKYKKHLNGLNEKVSVSIQQLFDNLSKQYQCEWRDEDSIYFTEFNMHIRPPYGPTNCEGGSDEKAKQRVTHILTEFSAKSDNN